MRELLDDPAFVVVTRSVLEGLLDDPVARIVETIELVAPTPRRPRPAARVTAGRPADAADRPAERDPRGDRQLETTLRQAEAELAAVRDQRARDAETIAQLQATLKLRDDLLEALRGKLTDL